MVTLSIPKRTSLLYVAACCTVLAVLTDEVILLGIGVLHLDCKVCLLFIRVAAMSGIDVASTILFCVHK